MLFVRKARASRSRRTRRPLTVAVALLTTLAIAIGVAQAASAPTLGAAGSFAVLAGSTVTNTGPTVVIGDLGMSPGTAMTGFPPGIMVGTIHAGDAVAGQAQVGANAAYGSLAGQACNTNLTGQDLGGLTLVAGAYCFGASAQLTGTLTLDGQGDPNAVFVFQIGSTLTTASSSGVSLINGASACNVFWQVGSSATLGTGTSFNGNIIALASITLTTGASVNGRVLALNGAVTMDSNNVSGCGSALPVTVRSFTASASGSSTTLRWQTASEAGLLGYNVYGQIQGKRVKLNRKLIAAKRTTGASYAFRYRAPSGQKAPSRFWLQAVNLGGSRTWSGAATARRVTS